MLNILANNIIAVAVAVMTFGIVFIVVAFSSFKKNSSKSLGDSDDKKEDGNKSKKIKSKPKLHETIINNKTPATSVKSNTVKQIIKSNSEINSKKIVPLQESQSIKAKSKTSKDVLQESKSSKKEIIEVEEWLTATSRKSKKSKPKRDGGEDEDGDRMEAVVAEGVILERAQEAHASPVNDDVQKEPFVETVSKKKKQASKETAINLPEKESTKKIAVALRTENEEKNKKEVVVEAMVEATPLVVDDAESQKETAECISQSPEEVKENLNEGIKENGSLNEWLEESSKTKAKKKKKKTPESRTKYQECPLDEMQLREEKLEIKTGEDSIQTTTTNEKGTLQNSLSTVKANEAQTIRAAKSKGKSKESSALKQELSAKENTVVSNSTEEVLINSTSTSSDSLLAPSVVDGLSRAEEKVQLTNGLASSQTIGDWQSAKTIKKKKVPTATLR